MLILAQLCVMAYAVRAVCERMEGDRRTPSQHRVQAVMGALLFAVLAFGVAALLQIEAEGRKYAIVREAWYFALLSAALTIGVALRVLKGDGPRDRC